MFTYGQIKPVLKEVIRYDTESDGFRRIVNQAVEALLDRGDWRATIQPIYCRAYRGCLTLPRHVYSIRKLNVCDREVEIGNVWWRFVDRDFYSHWMGDTYLNIVRPLGIPQASRQMDAVGYFPTYNDVPSPSYLQVYCDSKLDQGKEITIYGYDMNNQWIRTRDRLGNFKDGCAFQLAMPYAQTPVIFREGPITRVVKPETQGNVRLFASDLNGCGVADLASYEPTEESPSYQRYDLRRRFNGAANFHPDRCCGAMALVKVNYVPVKHDNDLILIDSTQGLKFACQSIQFSEATDVPNAEAYMTKAVHELNLQLANEQPDDQIPIVVKAFGTSRPRRYGIGRIV